MNEYAGYILTCLGTLGLGAVLVKLFDPLNRASARSRDVTTLREIIDELRSQAAEDKTRIDALQTRVELLEERERHQLTRAAVHEAWDQLSFQALLLTNPQHPPPPPLAWREMDR